jgi:prepilin-type N-terminal cleavage/methylation domain-containing protein
MRGFTLIELIIVIGISAVLVSLSASVYVSLGQRSDVDREAQELESVLSLARSKTLASENEQSFGVHIESTANEYFLFEGTAYSPIDPDNERFDIATGVSISSLNLNNGGSDIVLIA